MINKDELIEQLNLKKNTKQLAQHFNCHTGTIAKYLKLYDLKPNGNRKHTDQEVIEAAKGASSVSEVMVKLGLKPYGYAHSRFRERLRGLGITFDTAEIQRKIMQQGRVPKRKIEDYLILDGPNIGSSYLRKSLIKHGIKEEKCENCGITEWIGKPIKFNLDHINGNHNDNRLENLRILCPNCHSQTETHSKVKLSHQKIIKNKNYDKDLEQYPNLFDRDIDDYVISKESLSNEHKEFIKRYEYLGTIGNTPESTYVARIDDILAAVVIMGKSNSQYKIIPNVEECIIQRGASTSFAHKHINSKLIMFAIRDMVKSTNYRVFMGYADPCAGEIGTIYQACGFDFLGFKFGSDHIFKHPKLGEINRQSLKRTSSFKKFCKINGIKIKDGWIKSNGFKDLSNIPESIIGKWKSYNSELLAECEKIKIPKKGKYVFILGKTDRETKYLRSIKGYTPRTYPKRIPDKQCKVCGSYTSNPIYCSYECDKKDKERIKWPSDKELLSMCENESLRSIGFKLGVSDKAVKKRIDRISNI